MFILPPDILCLAAIFLSIKKANCGCFRHFRWPAHNTIGHATLIYSVCVRLANKEFKTNIFTTGRLYWFPKVRFWLTEACSSFLAQVNDDLRVAVAKQTYTYKHRKTEKEKQEEKSQKIRNASLAKFYVHIFTFLSLNYFFGVPLGSRKSRCHAIVYSAKAIFSTK